MAEIILFKTSAFEYLGFDAQDFSDLCDLAETTEYWAKAFDFVAELRDRSRNELKPRQVAWAQRIQDKLVDMRRKGRL